MLGLPASVERVVRQLRDDVLRGRLQEGDRLLSERELAERLDVNRGAVREALRVLAQLGLVEILPRGARAAPIQQASLDVLTHLLELDELPSPALIGQLMESAAFVFSGCAELAATRASAAELAGIRALLATLRSPDTSDEVYGEALHEVAQQLADASGNFVMGLLRQRMTLDFKVPVEQLRAMAPRVPREDSLPILEALDRALCERDGHESGRQFRALVELHRSHVVALLERAHEVSAQEAPAPSLGALAPSIVPAMRRTPETA